MTHSLRPEEAEAIAKEHRAQMRQRLAIVRARLTALSARAVAKARDTFVNGGGTLADDGARIEVVPELTERALERLFTNQTCAVHVPAFADEAGCDALAGWMMETCKFEKWESLIGETDLSDMFFGIGTPVNALAGSPERCVAYFDDALPTIRRVRAAAKGRLTPVDRLRLELDELWPSGASVRLDPVYRKKMLVGLGRLMTPDGMVGDVDTKTKGLVHTDASPEISPERGLFSANVYLRTPTAGGELDVWPVTPSKLDAMYLSHHLGLAFDKEHRERTQKIVRARLPPPQTVRVATGDLVIINAGRPHAVRGFGEGVRVTIQSFIDYERGAPLTLFA